MAQLDKDRVLSLLWFVSDRWPRNFCMLWVQQKKIRNIYVCVCIYTERERERLIQPNSQKKKKRLSIQIGAEELNRCFSKEDI